MKSIPYFASLAADLAESNSNSNAASGIETILVSTPSNGEVPAPQRGAFRKTSVLQRIPPAVRCPEEGGSPAWKQQEAQRFGDLGLRTALRYKPLEVVYERLLQALRAMHHEQREVG